MLRCAQHDTALRFPLLEPITEQLLKVDRFRLNFPAIISFSSGAVIFLPLYHVKETDAYSWISSKVIVLEETNQGGTKDE